MIHRFLAPAGDPWSYGRVLLTRGRPSVVLLECGNGERARVTDRLVKVVMDDDVLSRHFASSEAHRRGIECMTGPL